MKIKWRIEKKQGYWRPVLTYSIELEQWEIDLAIPKVSIKSKIATPPDFFSYATEEKNNNWKPKNYHTISTADWSVKKAEREIKLIWKPGKNPDYPEVEESFKMLREAYEKELIKAIESKGFIKDGELELTPQTKRKVAPYAAKQKMIGNK